MAQVDTTFEFEKRRNVPVTYDRNLVQATIRAMKRVSEIKAAREKRFYELRMRNKAKTDKAEVLRTIKTGIDLVISPLVQQKDQLNQAQKIKAKEAASSLSS